MSCNTLHVIQHSLKRNRTFYEYPWETLDDFRGEKRTRTKIRFYSIGHTQHPGAAGPGHATSSAETTLGRMNNTFAA